MIKLIYITIAVITTTLIQAKIEFVLNFLDELRLKNTKEKVVLVSHWTKTLDLFEGLFKTNGITFARIKNI